MAVRHVRNADGEVVLDSYKHFSESDPLQERALELMVVGVSTRKYRRSLEEVFAAYGSSQHEQERGESTFRSGHKETT